MKITDEAVEAAADAFDDTYEAHLNIGAAHWTDNRNVALRAALEAAAPLIVAQHEREAWRPIETAPKDGDLVIGFVPGSALMEIVFMRWETWEDDAGWSHDFGEGSVPMDMEPSHWMPLPSPPASEKERADG